VRRANGSAKCSAHGRRRRPQDDLSRRRTLLCAVSFLLLAVATFGPPHRSRVAAAAETDYVTVWYRTVDGVNLGAYVFTQPVRSPTLVLVHGGGWRQVASQSALLEYARALRTEGFVVVVPQYRLSPTGGHWHFPAHVEDVQAAADWAADRVWNNRYGIDRTRVGVLGTSAGGHLTYMVRGVDAVQGFSGPTDLVVGAGDEAVQNFIGCSFARCSSSYYAASPLHVADAAVPPTQIVHSAAESMPVEQATTYYDRLESLGVTARIIIVPGSQHGIALTDDVFTETVAWFDEMLV
jgi:acetyl esterase/lipase